MSKFFTELDGVRYKFISCQRSADWSTSLRKHLAVCQIDSALPQWVTTLCGATGSRDAWQGTRVKPMCPTCQAKFEKLGGELDFQ